MQAINRYFAVKHQIKWLEVHDGVNHWEKPVASDAKIER